MQPPQALSRQLRTPRDCPVLPAPATGSDLSPRRSDGKFEKLRPSAAFLGTSETRSCLFSEPLHATGQKGLSPIRPGLWRRAETFVSGQIRLQSELSAELWEKHCSKRTCAFNVNSLPH